MTKEWIRYRVRKAKDGRVIGQWYFMAELDAVNYAGKIQEDGTSVTVEKVVL